MADARVAPEDAPSGSRAKGERRAVLLATGGRRLGLPLESVREVIPARPAQRLPGAPASVLGLVNVRGRVVTVLDLARALGLPPGDGRPAPRVVLVEHRGRTIGLQVDDVLRMIRLDRDAPGAEEGDPVEILDVDALLGPIFG